jgi:hypothetical protein
VSTYYNWLNKWECARTAHTNFKAFKG